MFKNTERNLIQDRLNKFQDDYAKCIEGYQLQKSGENIIHNAPQMSPEYIELFLKSLSTMSKEEMEISIKVTIAAKIQELWFRSKMKEKLGDIDIASFIQDDKENVKKFIKETITELEQFGKNYGEKFDSKQRRKILRLNANFNKLLGNLEADNDTEALVNEMSSIAYGT